MGKPVIADNKPTKVKLEKGKEYFFCACGRSDNQPFCDGSHAGTGITPQRFVAEDNEEAVLCQCKQTGNPPYCDGTHQQFSDDLVGKEAPESSGDSESSGGSDKQDKAPKARATKEEPTVEFIHQLAREGLDGMEIGRAHV